MSKVPRASLSITILDDEDYRVLMTHKGGAEAFGVFVAVLLVGRERLQAGQARQPSDTESLRFDNSTTHILAMAYVSRKQLDKALSLLAEVAVDTGGKPWMSLDESGHLVIRSFFKFNTSAGWGGHRPGAGRPPKAKLDSPKRNQDESRGNQLESPLALALVLDNPPTPQGGGVGGSGFVNDKDDNPVPISGPHPVTDKERVRLRAIAAELFPDGHDFPDLACRFASLHGAANVAAAMKTAAAKGGRVRWPYVVGIARRYEAEGLPADAAGTARERPSVRPSEIDQPDYFRVPRRVVRENVN